MNKEIIQTDPIFTGEAYKYMLETDGLPTYVGMDPDDPTAMVKLFLPESRFEYYVLAVTDYGGELVMTGYCVSPLGPDCDEEGDMAVSDLIALRNRRGLPVERDCHWTPRPLSEIRKETANA